MQITLPVSIGEALDKLTILEIKLENITQESRLIHVRKEHETLKPILDPYINKCSRHYRLLKKINENLWNIMDKQRDVTITEQQYSDIARMVVEENDARFRAKLKINDVCSSLLKEQKGYAYTSLYNIQIDGNNLNVPVEFDKIIDNILEKSVRFDIINVTIKNYVRNEEKSKQVIDFFNYDKTIEFNL